jgi:hypothetical protein
MVKFFTKASGRINDLILSEIREKCGQLQPGEIVIKPNWVIHQMDDRYPIQVLVTDPRVIEATVLACAEIFPSCTQITVADCPLQSADWPLLCKQSGFSESIVRLSERFGSRVRFLDLRRDVFKVGKNFEFIPDTEVPHGDPEGYREIHLQADSHLEEISDQADRFSIVDHDASFARQYHRPGDHRYLVAQTYLNADLLINLPKWKTHSKTGITAALKNLVGINGDKAYLPHFRRGAPRWGGDEYEDADRWMAWLVSAVKMRVWRRRAWGYKLLRPGGKFLQSLYRQFKRLVKRSGAQPSLYVGGGGWYGNQTIWRMIYDLNRVMQCVDREGVLHQEQQRSYFCIVDGLIAGEGEGPLQPKPRALDCLAFGTDPFELDTALSWFMGFNPESMPIVSKRLEYKGPDWGQFDWNDLEVIVDGAHMRLPEAERNYHFMPPSGWRGHIER